MKNFLPLLLCLSFVCMLPVVRAQDAASPFELPAGDPMAILSLPDGLDKGKVSVAVSKSLLEEQWENLGWENNITTATLEQSKLTLKVFAVTNPADVKFYANYKSEKEVANERFQKIATREITRLEKRLAANLNLEFKKAKGDSIVDQAVPQ